VAELDGHGKDASLLVFGCARFQPDGFVSEVDLVPLERQYFAQAAPTRDVGKPHDWLDVAGQVTQNFQELRVFEESLTNVVFLKHWDMRLPEKFSALSCQTVRRLRAVSSRLIVPFVAPALCRMRM
jgi:hypothetical protein